MRAGRKPETARTPRRHTKTPVIAGKLIQRGIIHSCEQGGFQRLVLVIADGHFPSLFSTGTKFVAHGGQFHVQVIVVERHGNMIVPSPESVFLHEDITEIEAATVAFGHLISKGLHTVADGDFLVHTNFVAVEQLQPNVHIFGRTTDAELDFVAGTGGRFVHIAPNHSGIRHLFGFILVNSEFLRHYGQGVVQTLEFHDIIPRFQNLAFQELGLVVHHNFSLIDQSLGLLVVETVFGEEFVQLFIAKQLSVKGSRILHGSEIVDFGEVVVAVNLARDAALGGLPTEVAHGDLVLAEV